MRKTICWNQDWLFSKDKTSWESVTLPHTWNAVDGMDGSNYYRGECLYQKQLETPLLQPGERVCLEILALSLCGRVLVNGRELASHEGGFSSFTVDITEALLPARLPSVPSNTITILADNTPHSNIYPQMADFTFYGGLYRGVNLLILPEHHFEADFHGAPGLAVTPEVTDIPGRRAMLHLNSWVKNPTPDYTVEYTITDAVGNEIARCCRPSESPKADLLLSDAHLWQGVEDPYLYTCTATLVYRNEAVDQVSSRFGVRCFSVDSQKGFFLNGRPVMLRGVSRHQD